MLEDAERIGKNKKMYNEDYHTRNIVGHDGYRRISLHKAREELFCFDKPMHSTTVKSDNRHHLHVSVDFIIIASNGWAPEVVVIVVVVATFRALCDAWRLGCGC